MEWNNRHVVTTLGIVLGVVALILGIVLILSTQSRYNRSHPNQQEIRRLEVCREIADPALRVICIRGTGY